jgi:hypothetical protein
MITRKEALDRAVEVSNFECALETLRKMHAIYVVNIAFNGYPSMNLGSEDNLTLVIKRTAIEYQTERVEVFALDLQLSGIEPGDWKTEFQK